MLSQGAKASFVTILAVFLSLGSLTLYPATPSRAQSRSDAWCPERSPGLRGNPAAAHWAVRQLANPAVIELDLGHRVLSGDVIKKLLAVPVSAVFSTQVDS